MRVAEPIALTSIFPYAWRLVEHYNVTSEANAPFFAGILISAFSLAEACSGMFWGGLSDRIGRKPVLIMGCMGTIASLLVVGFASDFWVALAGRFLGGALNGNIGVVSLRWRDTFYLFIQIRTNYLPSRYRQWFLSWSRIQSMSVGDVICF